MIDSFRYNINLIVFSYFNIMRAAKYALLLYVALSGWSPARTNKFKHDDKNLYLRLWHYVTVNTFISFSKLLHSHYEDYAQDNS